MYELKTLSPAAVPGALAKAERYRLLREPWQAESICRDVLAIDPGNQPATVMLVLAMTDQFERGVHAQDALNLAAGLQDEYERAYYSGIVHERRAIALIRQSDYRASYVAYTLFLNAMDAYERAEAIRPPGNDEALLRWNTCVRFLQRNPHMRPMEEREQPVMSE